MWGIVPAAGRGTRLQPLAFSKELLPVGMERLNGSERPRAVADCLVERMILAGVDKICFVVGPGKADILSYFGEGRGDCRFAYVVQPRPVGLCDALFRAMTVVGPGDDVVIGLPDTVWYPEGALGALPAGALSFLLFPVACPERFDAVVTDGEGRVTAIEVKHPAPSSTWIWGALRLPGAVLAELNALWIARGCDDEYLGTLVNAYLAAGGRARGVPAGHTYIDVGTIEGYHAAVRLLAERAPETCPAEARP